MTSSAPARKSATNSPTDRYEVVHSDVLHDEELSWAVGLAVHGLLGLRRRRATLARQEPVGVAGRLRSGERVACFAPKRRAEVDWDGRGR
jgi:hypothetical protein